MTTTQHPSQPRLLSLKELAALVRGYRALRRWTQADLAESCGLDLHIIEQVEDEQTSSQETRRALAEAFDFADIDVFNQPFSVPSREDFEQADAEDPDSDPEHVTLEAFVLVSGEELAGLAIATGADLISQSFEMGMQADKVFAALTDYSREYRQDAGGYSESQKLGIYQELEDYLNELKALGVSICYATRKMVLQPGHDSSASPQPVTILYLVTFPRGEEPESFVTTRVVQ